MRTFLSPRDRQVVVARLRALRPDTPARWGSMDAPRMVAHLIDQMGHTVSETRLRPSRNPLRLPVIKQLALFWVPWPKARIKGPARAFVTRPGDWRTDLATLEALVDRFVERPADGFWASHPYFGSMSKSDWGAFCYRHFDHHLRQFGN